MVYTHTTRKEGTITIIAEWSCMLWYFKIVNFEVVAGNDSHYCDTKMCPTLYV